MTNAEMVKMANEAIAEAEVIAVYSKDEAVVDTANRNALNGEELWLAFNLGSLEVEFDLTPSEARYEYDCLTWTPWD